MTIPKWFRPKMGYVREVALIAWGISLPRGASPDNPGGLSSSSGILLVVGILLLVLAYVVTKVEREHSD
jgi:hypothetical protein